jgi:hypothetical protein
MKTNFDQWSRRKPRGLYLIELRQRLAHEKTLRQQVLVRLGEPPPLKARESLLDQLAPGHPEPVTAG